MDIPLQALPSHNEPLNSVCGLLNRNTQIKSGEAVATFPNNEDWFHTLHNTQTVWKQTGHTTRPFIPVVDRGESVCQGFSGPLH